MLSYDQLKLLSQILATSGIISSLLGLNYIRKYENKKLEYQKLFNITQYLAKIIEDNDVMLSEFDLIALRELGVLTIVEEMA